MPPRYSVPVLKGSDQPSSRVKVFSPQVLASDECYLHLTVEITSPNPVTLNQFHKYEIYRTWLYGLSDRRSCSAFIYLKIVMAV